MNRLPPSLLLLLLFIVALAQQKPVVNRLYLEDYIAADKVYRQAEQLSSLPGYTDETGEKEAAMNREALKGFKNILPTIEKANDDSLKFYCYYKIGVLEHYFDSLIAAKQHYEMAIATKSRLPSFPDSLLFKIYLFVGGIQYGNNQFDSAMINYKKAEAIAGRYESTLDGTNRLYNTLGAMYYETGNYQQAKNYFEKAITLLGTPNPSTEGLLINYKINLGATLTRLEEFDEANKIYQELLKQDINKNDVLHNLGTINLKLGAAAKALSYFKKVNYTNSKVIRLSNEMGLAYESIGRADSAQYYYQKAMAENQKWNKGIKTVQSGLSLKYIGDLKYKDGDFNSALQNYQQAAIQLVDDFNSVDIYRDPDQYNGVFSYINLFNLLTAKGNAFEKLYQKENLVKYLEASLNAYRHAFKLADYVEKTYDSDEARLFLNKIKYTVHGKPIDISLLLFNLTGNKDFLEDAYLFDQQNKASILSLNVRENELRNTPGINNELFREESSVKSAITRLSLKAAQTTDTSVLAGINAATRDYEIQLGKLQEKINADPAYGEKQLIERIPSVKEVQEKLDPVTALLSYHLSEERLLILFISANKFEYSTVPADKELLPMLDSFKISLQNVTGDERYTGSAMSVKLYQRLISPVRSKLGQIERLIIIPDDELNYLPFEALQDENKKYLIQEFSIQYQYSTALLGNKTHGATTTTLAFAPFASKGYTDSTGLTLTSLPASKEEVNNLQGEIFIDDSATKQQFFQKAGQYGIIHLATHASVDNEFPLRSFITFYPGKNKNDYKLYAAEIYNMNFVSAQLIILSACETGTGKLVHGEGLMSLSRAFAYAGCPNIITSLWKAEDRSTAYISQRLHHYLQKGAAKDKALQQAKLDLLNSADIDPRFKAPNYWAHLIFIGQYEPGSSSAHWWWWIAAGISIVILMYLIFKRKKSRVKP